LENAERKVRLIVENFEDVKKFFDYLIIDDDGWKGIRDDAPESAKKAYDEYIKKQNTLEKKGYKV
jgi:hypothetical protein